MGIRQRTINGRAIYEGIRLNGAEHIRERWYTFDADGKPTAGCALGLVAIHLGIRGESSENFQANLASQLKKLLVPESSRWYRRNSSASYNNVADLIMTWNDDYTAVEDGTYDRDGYPNTTKTYVLPTFEDVRQMAHDLLEPHFDTEFTVDEWVFDAPNFAGTI